MDLIFQITLIVFIGMVLLAGAVVASQMLLYAMQRRRERKERGRIESKVDKTAQLLMDRQEAAAVKTDGVAVKVDAARIQAVEAAKLLKINQDDVRAGVLEAAQAARELKRDIMEVHALVNSRYTALNEKLIDAKQGELTAMKLWLLMMHKMIKVTETPPTEAERLDISAAEKRIDSLTQELESKNWIEEP